VPSRWPKQQLFDDHSNVSYIKTEQSPVYDTLATKNWTVVTTTWSNTQSTPIGLQDLIGADRQERSIVYTPYPRSDPCVYAVSEKERHIFKESGETVEYVYSESLENYEMVPRSVIRRECNPGYVGKSIEGSGATLMVSVSVDLSFLDVKPVIARSSVRSTLCGSQSICSASVVSSIFQVVT